MRRLPARGREIPLRVGLGWTEYRAFTDFDVRRLRRREIAARASGRYNRESIRVGNLLVSCPAAGLDADVCELVDQEIQRNAIVQAVTDGGKEAVHQARNS